MQDGSPKISVLMSTYKEPIIYVEQAVDSILNQTHQNLEFIILLDDPTNKELNAFLTNKAQSDPRIRLLPNEVNLGLVASLNKGLSFCSGDYIARMDADDYSHPDRLEKQLSYLEDQGYDLVGCWYTHFRDDEGEFDAKLQPVTSAQCKKKLRWTNCLAHPAWLGKKEIFSKLGGYRDIKACEDYDFLLRAVLSGFKLGNYPGFLFKYRLNPNGISLSNFPKQRATADYLARHYRKGSTISIEAYKAYIDSEHYRQDVENLATIERLYREYAQAPGMAARIKILLTMLPKRTFLYRRIKMMGDHLRTKWLYSRQKLS